MRKSENPRRGSQKVHHWTSPPQRAVWAKEIHGLNWELLKVTERSVGEKKNVSGVRKLGVSHAWMVCWYLKEV